MNCADTRFAVETERTALDALGGGCSLPIGIHVAQESAGHYRVYAQVVAPDGESMVQLDQHVLSDIDACSLGSRIAQDLISRGALALLETAEMDEATA